MFNVRQISDDYYYVGGNDRRLELFENVYPIPDGVSYNSYLLLDNKTVLLDTADASISKQFIENVEHVLEGRPLDYVIVDHMEPDHCATLSDIINLYPDVTLVVNNMTLRMIKQFFDFDTEDRVMIVKEGDTLNTGHHVLHFVLTPMVHWPEVMMTYDSNTGILFSADAFGTFGALHGNLFTSEMDLDESFWNEARRYYTNIVGKYGVQVSNALKKAHKLDIKLICPLHGPIWDEDIDVMIEHTASWAEYKPEVKGVLIAYGSIYGGTANAAEILANQLSQKGIHNIKVYDVSKTDPSYILAEAFKYSHLVFASASYNAGLFTPMQTLLTEIKEHQLQNRTCVLIENGTWAPSAKKTMKTILEPLKTWNYIGEEITIKSRVKDNDYDKILALSDAIVESMTEVSKEESPIAHRRWRCKVCGYEFIGDELPDNFICPLCKHPASDFEEITE